MSDAKLRSSLIRLAHAKPELRSTLLPLLKGAAAGRSDDEARAINYKRYLEADKALRSVLTKYKKSPYHSVVEEAFRLWQNMADNMNASWPSKWNDFAPLPKVASPASVPLLKEGAALRWKAKDEERLWFAEITGA